MRGWVNAWVGGCEWVWVGGRVGGRSAPPAYIPPLESYFSMVFFLAGFRVPAETSDTP